MRILPQTTKTARGKMKKVILFLIIGLVPVFAQEKLGLREAIAIAMENNPRLIIQKAEIERIGARKWQNTAIPNPVIGLEKEGIASGGSGFSEQRQRVTQFLPSPLSIYYGYKETDLRQAAMFDSLKQLEIKIRRDVKSAYTRLIHSRRILALRRQIYDNTVQLNRVTQDRFQAGDASEIELLNTSIKMNQAQNNLDEAEYVLDTRRYQLFTTIGLPPEKQSYAITFPDTLNHKNVPYDQESLLNRLTLLPGYKAGSREIEAAQNAYRKGWADLLPALSVSYYRQDFGSGYNHYGVDVGLSVPLWFWFNQKPAIQSARAVIYKTEARRQHWLLNQKEAIERGWHNFKKSRAIIKRYEAQSSRQARRLLEAAIAGYRVGEVSLLVLIDAQQSYLDTRIGYYNALRDYFLSLIQLEMYTGEEWVLP